MELRVLGPLEVVDADAVVTLARRRERELLVALALGRGRPVAAGTIGEMLWAGRDADGRGALATYVMRVRERFGRDVVATAEGGYALGVGVITDAQTFETGLATARDHDGAARAERLRTALAAWRGRPYDELGEWPEAVHQRDRLLALRDDATDALLECDDLSAWSVADLVDLVAARPRNERRCAVVMRALYRAGHQVDALDVFDRTRGALRDASGLDPSPELVRLQRAVLDHDPVLATPELRPVGWAERRDAARRARDDHGPERSVAEFDAAVGAARRAPAPTESLVALLVETGDAHRAAGDPGAATAAYLEAGALAREGDDVRGLALAALAASGTGLVTNLDPLAPTVVLLDDAARRLPVRPSALRSRVLARLSVVRCHHEPPGEGRVRADEALALARMLKDTEALGVALEARVLIDYDPSGIDRLEQLVGELATIGEHRGRDDWIGSAAVAQARIDASRGDIDGALARLAAVASSGSDPVTVYAAEHRRVLDATRRGDWPGARRAAAAVERAADRAHFDASAAALARWGMNAVFDLFSGEPGPPPPAMVGVVLPHSASMELTMRASGAAAAAVRGAVDDARAALDTVDPVALRSMDRDMYWLPSLVYLTEAVAAVGDRRLAAAVVELATPFSDLTVVDGGLIYLGAVAHHLGVAAGVLGDRALSRRHLRAARARHEAAGAVFWTARTASALADRPPRGR